MEIKRVQKCIKDRQIRSKIIAKLAKNYHKISEILTINAKYKRNCKFASIMSLELKLLYNFTI